MIASFYLLHWDNKWSSICPLGKMHMESYLPTVLHHACFQSTCKLRRAQGSIADKLYIMRRLKLSFSALFIDSTSFYIKVLNLGHGDNSVYLLTTSHILKHESAVLFNRAIFAATFSYSSSVRERSRIHAKCLALWTCTLCHIFPLGAWST